MAVLRARLAIGSATDRRLNLINKLIQGIQTIKTYVWEQPIIRRIHQARRVECRRFLRLYFFKGLSLGIFRNGNILLTFPILLTPLAQGMPLVASTVFAALSLIDSLALGNLYEMNYGMNSLADYCSVVKRIEEVLLL